MQLHALLWPGDRSPRKVASLVRPDRNGLKVLLVEAPVCVEGTVVTKERFCNPSGFCNDFVQYEASSMKQINCNR